MLDYDFGIKISCEYTKYEPVVVAVAEWCEGNGLKMGENVVVMCRHFDKEDPHVTFYFEDMNWATMCKLTFGGA